MPSRKRTLPLLPALSGGLSGLVLALAPIIFIHRGFSGLFDHWQENAFYGLMFLLCFLSGMLGFGLTKGLKETVRQRKLVWLSMGFFFLYLSTAALCEKLSVTLLPGDLWRALGLLIVLTGSLLRLWSIQVLGSLHSGFVTIQENHQLVRRGPYRWLRHPSYLGALILIIGIPLIYSVWFPLLALPGVIVALKWRIDDEEQLLSEHFGAAYEEYRKTSWRLCPFIY